MSELNPVRCTYSAAGHARHPIQHRLAAAGRPPVTVQIVGEHDRGIVVAPKDDPDHIEVWCMHRQWREVVQAARARGVTTIESYDHSLARIDGEYISHTSPRWWRECPTDQEMTPLMTGFLTKDQLVAELTRLQRERGEG